MRTVIKRFRVYPFDELSDAAKAKAAADQIQFMLDVGGYSDDVSAAIEKMERNRTPWFIHECIWSCCRDEVMAGLREFSYLENGDIFVESEE